MADYSEYTLDDLRELVATLRGEGSEQVAATPREELYAILDSVLARVLARAWDEGYGAGAEDALHDEYGTSPRADRTNPYRKEGDHD